MKRLVYALIVVSLILNIYSADFVVASELSNIHEEPIKVAGDNNYPPYEFLDNAGNYRGFNVDIIRAIAIELGIEIELIPTSWQDAMLKLENGEVDAVQGMTETPFREERFDFTERIVENSQAIFVLNKTKFINQLSDLEGRKVAIQSEDVTKEIINKLEMPDIDIVEKINQSEAIELLLSEKVDAFVGNRATGIYYIQKHDLTETINIIGEPIYETDYSIAVKSGNYELLNELETGLEAIRENGNYDKIYEKWFGKTIDDVNRKWINLLRVSLTALVIAILIIGMIYYWNKNLTEEVGNRTKEIAKSNRFKDTVINSMISGIVVFNKKFTVIQANDNIEKLIGKRVFEGQKYSELTKDIVPREALDKVLEGEMFRKDLKWELGNGDVKFIDCSLVSIKSPDEVEGYLLLLNDRTTIFELFNLVKHNDKMKALGELSAGVAHELRNPLTSIKTFIDLIPRKIEDEEFRNQLVTIVPKEIKRMDDLVVSLLDYAKPKASDPEEIQLDDLLNEVLVLLNQKIKAKKLEIITNGVRVNFYADRSQMTQILLNILLNSVDSFYEEGTIEISASINENRLELEIEDDGCGIPANKLDKLFNPFYSSKKSGYGIGLSITERLVKENNGEIKIDSIEEVGTSVKIYLPTEKIDEGENSIE